MSTGELAPRSVTVATVTDVHIVELVVTGHTATVCPVRGRLLDPDTVTITYRREFGSGLFTLDHVVVRGWWLTDGGIRRRRWPRRGRGEVRYEWDHLRCGLESIANLWVRPLVLDHRPSGQVDAAKLPAQPDEPAAPAPVVEEPTELVGAEVGA